MKKKGWTQLFGGENQSPLQFFLYLQILTPYKKYPEECAWSDYCNNFEKRERVFSVKATNLQHVRLEMEKRKQNL